MKIITKRIKRTGAFYAVLILKDRRIEFVPNDGKKQTAIEDAEAYARESFPILFHKSKLNSLIP